MDGTYQAFADVSPASFQRPTLPSCCDERSGKLTVEFRDYLAFVEELFVIWLKGAPIRNELWVCPELGMSFGGPMRCGRAKKCAGCGSAHS